MAKSPSLIKLTAACDVARAGIGPFRYHDDDIGSGGQGDPRSFITGVHDVDAQRSSFSMTWLCVPTLRHRRGQGPVS